MHLLGTHKQNPPSAARNHLSALLSGSRKLLEILGYCHRIHIYYPFSDTVVAAGNVTPLSIGAINSGGTLLAYGY